MNEARNTTERYDELMVILAEEMDGVHTRQYETAVKNATQQRDDRLHQTQSNQQTLSDEISANMRVVDGDWQKSIEHHRTLLGGDDVNLPTISNSPNKPLSDLFSSFRQNYTSHTTLTVQLEQALKEEKRKAEEQRRLAEERLRLEVARKRQTITIIAIGMVTSLIFAILGINFYTNLVETRRIQQATATQQQIVNATATQQIANVNATATQQIANVNATATQQVAQAMTPMVSNRDWMPFELDFGGVTMVLVPVGCFMMGSNEGDDDEQPVHEQCVTEPFWFDKYEVTNALYGSLGCWYSWEADQPRNCVDPYDAQAFCEARGGTLPSEMQWEYAARGVESWDYPWGNTYDAERVIGMDDPTYGNAQTAPVGSRPDGASWVGAMDMSGNVWEWTSTAYQDYPYTQEDEQPNNQDIIRVFRGGSFNFPTNDLRSANRINWARTNNHSFIGFRCALSLNNSGL